MRDIHGQERGQTRLSYFLEHLECSHISKVLKRNSKIIKVTELCRCRRVRADSNDTGPRRAPSCPKAMPDAAAAVGVGPELIAERSGGCSSLGDIYTLSLHDAGIKVASGLEG